MTDKTELYNYLQNNLSVMARKYYSISMGYNNQLYVETKPPFERTNAYVYEKNNKIELKISIPNSGAHAYTFKDASDYLWLLNGCAEINTLFKKYIEGKDNGKI